MADASEKTTVVTTPPVVEKPRPRTSILHRYNPYSSSSSNFSSGGSFFCFLLILLVLAGITALVLYLVYRPSKPRFSLNSASIFLLNATADTNAPYPNLVSSSVQFTLIVRNPSGRSSISYDRLSIYISYRNQPITPPIPLPPLVQGQDSTVAVSPVVGGMEVPVSGEVGEGLRVEGRYGVVSLRVVLTGRVKYRSGPFRSAWTGLYVRCDALVVISGGRDGGRVPLIGEPQCDVDA